MSLDQRDPPPPPPVWTKAELWIFHLLMLREVLKNSKVHPLSKLGGPIGTPY